MVIYIATFAVFSLILVASYRALGHEAASEEEAETFVLSVQQWLRRDTAEVQIFADPAQLAAASEEQAVIDSARDVRKKVSGYQQQLSRLDVIRGDMTDKAPAELLVESIECIGWACRIVESRAHSRNPSVCQAVATLYEGGLEALADAEKKLSAAGAPTAG